MYKYVVYFKNNKKWTKVEEFINFQMAKEYIKINSDKYDDVRISWEKA